VLRDAARADTRAHQRVERWERLVTRLGHNKCVEGLHFCTVETLTAMLRDAGFQDIEVHGAAGRDSNVLITSRVESSSGRERVAVSRA